MTPRRLIVFFVATATLFSNSVAAQTVPSKPSGYINDFTQTLSAETKQKLEIELAAFEASTTNQITVAIVQNLNGDYI